MLVTGIRPDSVRADTLSDAMSELSLHPDDELFPNPNRLQCGNLSSGTSDLLITRPSPTVNSCCPDHPSKLICNVCMPCKVGLCPRCMSSKEVGEHIKHEILDIDDAFGVLKTTCDSLIEKGLKAQERSSMIQRLSRSLLLAHQSKNLAVFKLIDELTALFDNSSTVNDTKQQNDTLGSCSVAEILSDHTSDFDNALRALHSGTAELQNLCIANKSGSVLCTKMAAVATLIDMLRIKLHHNDIDGLEENIGYLCNCTGGSELCCARLIMLGGVDLLLSWFEICKSNEVFVFFMLVTLGNVSLHYASHHSVVTTKMVKMLAYVIQNFKMTEYELQANSCRILSYILGQESVEWPQDCLSREKISILLMDTCKGSLMNGPLLVRYGSFHVAVALLSQQVSEAPKYWAVWLLNRYTLIDPDEYCPIVVRDGGVPVLKQQDHAHDYVKDMANSILKRIESYALDQAK